MSTSGSLGIGLSHFPNSVHVKGFWDCILDIVMFCCRDWVLLDCCKECWWFCVSRQSTWLDSNSDCHTCSGQWLSSLVSLGQKLRPVCLTHVWFGGEVETWVKLKHGIWGFPSLALPFLGDLLTCCQPGSSCQKDGGLSVGVSCPSLSSNLLQPPLGDCSHPEDKPGRRNKAGEQGTACLLLSAPASKSPPRSAWLFSVCWALRKSFLCILSRVNE